MKKLVFGSIIFLGIIASLNSLAAGDNLPNLVALPASNIRIEETNGTKLLRFSTTSWNNGRGPLELVAGDVDQTNDKQRVFQRVYTSDGSYHDEIAGDFRWHLDHNHFHLDDYARYTLQPVNAPGASDVVGSKTTFCVMDTTKINIKLPGAPKRSVYSTCGSSVQGMSVGWGDTYGYYLSGQELNITNLPDGDYDLKIEIDPNNKLLETENTVDNTSVINIRITGNSVSVIGSGPGRGNR
ncbi:MAG: lysyl oxidase family protein [Patescibacteria group bacterium]